MSDRRLSFWGWGYEDRFPDDDVRAGMAAHVAAVLGIEPPAPRSPPSLDSIVLPAPRFGAPALLDSVVTTDKLDRVMHTYGRAYKDIVRAFEGDFSSAPDAVAYPRNESDVAALLAWCSREGIAVVPYGGGTSVVGGLEVAREHRRAGALSLDLCRMDRVLEVDTVSRAARIEAGTRGPRIEEQLAAHTLTLRHYPQSFEFSTLGGWIATRAGGHFATLYTHIDDLVECVRMVTPSGIFQTRRVPASGAGPAPERLVLGSEGALGVITEAWVRLQQRPAWRSSASVNFERFFDAVEVVRKLSQSGLHPSNCRLLDEREATLNGVSAGGTSVLIIAFESADHALEPWMDRALAIALDGGGSCPKGPVHRHEGTRSEAEQVANAWRQAFFEAPYLQSALISLGMVVDTFETACTWDRFRDLHSAVTGAVTEAMQRVCGAGIVTCRFTHVYPDGPAPYFTFVAPGRAGAQLEQWQAIKTAASEALAAAGATITHHHAVGRMHRPWYDRERPELFGQALQAVRRELDPQGVMNPGVLVDP